LKGNPDLDYETRYSQLSDEVKYYDRWTIVGKPAPAGKPDEEQFGYVDIVKVVGRRVVMDEHKDKIMARRDRVRFHEMQQQDNITTRKAKRPTT
jgi:hypothetical protein